MFFWAVALGTGIGGMVYGAYRVWHLGHSDGALIVLAGFALTATMVAVMLVSLVDG